MGSCCSRGSDADDPGADSARQPLLDEAVEASDDQTVLVVHLLRCSALPAKDVGGTSDPYVTFKLFSPDPSATVQEFKSPRKNGTCDPRWEPPETFRFLVRDQQRERLVVSVYDWDRLGEHPPLGDAVIKLKTLEAAGSSIRSLALVDPETTRTMDAHVHLELELTTWGAVRSVVTDEIWENQRWQPIIEWGSTYPGHLYPSDPGQWSDDACENHSMEFDEIAPPLPDGWTGSGWSFSTLQGDSQGWQYAVTFGQSWYPEAGSLHYVRRRKWTRTRRLDPAASSAVGIESGGGGEGEGEGEAAPDQA